jgi:hypothetical protein
MERDSSGQAEACARKMKEGLSLLLPEIGPNYWKFRFDSLRRQNPENP